MFSSELVLAPMATPTWRRCGIVYSLDRCSGLIGSVQTTTPIGMSSAMGGCTLRHRAEKHRPDWQTDRPCPQADLNGVLSFTGPTSGGQHLDQSHDAANHFYGITQEPYGPSGSRN